MKITPSVRNNLVFIVVTAGRRKTCPEHLEKPVSNIIS